MLLLTLATLSALSYANTVEAIIITYSNPGPNDSQVHGGFTNIVHVLQPGFYTTSDFLSHANVISRADTAIGHGTFPLTESTATARVEIGTNLNSPTGTGVRTVFSPIPNASTFTAAGQTYQPAPNGNYDSHAVVHSENLATGATPTPWVVNVLPSVGETPGTPVDVTINAWITGTVSVAGTSTADATWDVTTTTHGSVMAGTVSQVVVGSSPISDTGTLTFTIPLGTSFQLLVDYETNATENGAAANSFSEVTASAVQILAAFPSPPMFTANFSGQLIGTNSGNPARPYKANKTIPVKIQLKDAQGATVTDAVANGLDVRVALT